MRYIDDSSLFFREDCQCNVFLHSLDGLKDKSVYHENSEHFLYPELRRWW